MNDTPIIIRSEYEGRTEIEFPREYAENWSEWHEGTTPEDAPRFAVFEDVAGAYICECCGVSYHPTINEKATTCEHPNPIWLSGEEGVVITLNGPIAARCPDCGMTATID